MCRAGLLLHRGTGDCCRPTGAKECFLAEALPVLTVVRIVTELVRSCDQKRVQELASNNKLVYIWSASHVQLATTPSTSQEVVC